MRRHLVVCAILIGLGAMIATLPLSMSAVAATADTTATYYPSVTKFTKLRYHAVGPMSWGTVHY